jgi:hypothetical protein
MVRESSKQGNDKVARQIEAAHRTSLAKGEVGIREKKRAPTLGDFADKQFLPWAESGFSAKRKTWLYFRNGVRRLKGYEDKNADGERHREFVLSPEEESRYLAAARVPLVSVATVPADTGMRPEECLSPPMGIRDVGQWSLRHTAGDVRKDRCCPPTAADDSQG